EGGTPQEISQEFESGNGAVDFRISSDSAYVYYRMISVDDEGSRLYRVAIDGGISLELNGPMPDDATHVGTWELANDARVVFKGEIDTLGVNEIYSALTNGGGRIKLNDPFVFGGDVDFDEISPDGQWVVYRADAEVDNRSELY